MLTDFGLAHANINPTRRKEIKSLPDNKPDMSSQKQKSSSCDLNVRYLLIFVYIFYINYRYWNKIFFRLTTNDQAL